MLVKHVHNYIEQIGLLIDSRTISSRCIPDPHQEVFWGKLKIPKIQIVDNLIKLKQSYYCKKLSIFINQFTLTCI